MMDNIRDDRHEMGLEVIDATALAASERGHWRKSVVRLPERAEASSWH